MNELLRNGSGYVDFTAYSAIKNIERENEDMEYKRGEIFEYSANGYDWRKALVVSADFRKDGRYISVIVLADEPKGVVNVPITTNNGIMYADCGLVCFSTNERLGNYLRNASKAEMEQIDEGIAKCLGIEQKTVEKIVEVPVEKIVAKPIEVPEIERIENMKTLIELQTELAIYKDMYERLLEKMIG